MAEKGQGNINYPPPPSRDKDEESLVEEHDENGTRVRRYEKSESADIQEPAVQVETKPGLAWTETEPQKPLGRKRVSKKVVVDKDSSVQVETKTPPTQADIAVESSELELTREEREKLVQRHTDQYEDARKELLGLYPKDANNRTEISLETLQKLQNMFDRKLHNLTSTDSSAKAEIDSEIASFMAEQRTVMETKESQENEVLTGPLPQGMRRRKRGPETDAKEGETVEPGPDGRVEPTLEPASRELHEPINFGKELKNIRSGTKEEQKQKLADFKEKLIEQKKGIAEIQKKLFEEVEKNPDAELYDYLYSVKDLQEKHALNDEQKFAIRIGLRVYRRTHQAIKENTEEYVDKETGKIDGPKLYEKLFGQKPKGRVEIILRPAIIYIRIEDLDDYAIAYNNGATDQITEEIKGKANDTGGCLLNNIQGLEGAVALEKATNGRFDKMDKYSNATLQHEEQHAFNKIINRGYNAEWNQDLTNKDRGEVGIESQVKDEISAFFKDGRSAEEIRRILLDPKTIYKYGFEYKKEEQEKTEFSQKYVDLVENGIQAYSDLLEKGYSREDAQALLFVEPLTKWHKTAERLQEGEEKGTPKENRGKFNEVMARAGEMFGWYKSSEEKFIRRKEELRVKAEKIGGIEGFFRTMGEYYNKLGWKSKLAIGATLGLGAGISAAALVPEALVLCVAGIAAQRTAGLMSMYLKFEKASPPYGGEREGKFWQWGQKEKAMAKALLYTTGMSLGMGYAVKEIGGTEWARVAQEKFQHTVQGWLGTMLGHHAPEAVSGSTEAAPTPIPAGPPTGAAQEAWKNAGHPIADSQNVIPPQAPGPIPTATPDFKPPTVSTPSMPHSVAGLQAEVRAVDNAIAAKEAIPSGLATADGVVPVEGEVPHGLVTEPPGTMPEVSVDAVEGKGYEYMMKRLWDDPQMANFKAEDYFKPDVPLEQQPDIYKLLSATPETIDKVVHQIATNPDHNFYHANGENVRIDMGEHMTINAEGNIQLGDVVKAPEGAQVTAPFHPDAPVAPHAEVPAATPKGVQASATLEDSAAKAASENFAPLPEVPPAVTEPPPVQPLDKVDMNAVTPDQTIPKVETPEYPKTTTALDHDATSSVSAESAVPPSVVEGPNAYINSLGTPINPDVTHAYTCPNGVCFFGGEISDVQAQDYALEHNVAVLVDKSEKSFWGFPIPRTVEFVPAKDGTVTMVVLNGPSYIPDPKTFTKRIF